MFSCHYSRDDGWTSVAAAVLEAGFKLLQTQPVKAEMSVAIPKLAAKSPIDLDVLMVCRKAAADRRPLLAEEIAMKSAAAAAGAKVRRFNGTGRRLSLNDVRIVVYSQALVELCAGPRSADVLTVFEGALDRCAVISQRLFADQDDRPRSVAPRPAELPFQASLF